MTNTDSLSPPAIPPLITTAPPPTTTTTTTTTATATHFKPLSFTSSVNPTSTPVPLLSTNNPLLPAHPPPLPKPDVVAPEQSVSAATAAEPRLLTLLKEEDAAPCSDHQQQQQQQPLQRGDGAASSLQLARAAGAAGGEEEDVALMLAAMKYGGGGSAVMGAGGAEGRQEGPQVVSAEHTSVNTVGLHLHTHPSSYLPFVTPPATASSSMEFIHPSSYHHPHDHQPFSQFPPSFFPPSSYATPAPSSAPSSSLVTAGVAAVGYPNSPVSERRASVVEISSGGVGYVPLQQQQQQQQVIYQPVVAANSGYHPVGVSPTPYVPTAAPQPSSYISAPYLPVSQDPSWNPNQRYTPQYPSTLPSQSYHPLPNPPPQWGGSTVPPTPRNVHEMEVVQPPPSANPHQPQSPPPPLTTTEDIDDPTLPGPPPYPCPTCQKPFPTRPTLRDHLRLHNRARNHPCVHPGCTKTFYRSQDLLRHQSTHMLPSERPHLCPNGCGRRFGRADAAHRHAKTSQWCGGGGGGGGGGGVVVGRELARGVGPAFYQRVPGLVAYTSGGVVGGLSEEGGVVAAAAAAAAGGGPPSPTSPSGGGGVGVGFGGEDGEVGRSAVPSPRATPPPPLSSAICDDGTKVNKRGVGEEVEEGGKKRRKRGRGREE
ncbi:hypothetical protein HDU67_010244, partial [Dinochytrium kinnereticum]